MSKLGIDPILIAFQVANFFVLMFVLKKYLYKPVVDMIEKRQANVSETDSLRQQLEKERSEIESEKEKVLDDVRKEADTVLSEVKKEGEEMKQAIISEAKESAKRIVERAEAESKEKEQTIREQLKDDVKVTAVEAVQQVLSAELTQEQKDTLLQTAVQKFA